MNKKLRNSGAIIAGITISAAALTIGMDKIPAEPLAESSASVLPSWTVVATTVEAGQDSASPDWTAYLYHLSGTRKYGTLVFGNTVYYEPKTTEVTEAAKAVCQQFRSTAKKSDQIAFTMWLNSPWTEAETVAIVAASMVDVCPEFENR